MQKDVQARWTQKHGKSFYGYKRYAANTDRKWGFIRQGQAVERGAAAPATGDRAFGEHPFV